MALFITLQAIIYFQSSPGRFSKRLPAKLAATLWQISLEVIQHHLATA
jgi:hypothetical protein